MTAHNSQPVQGPAVSERPRAEAPGDVVVKIQRQLATRAAATRTDLATVQDALAAAMSALENARLASATEQDREIASLAERLAADADEAAEALARAHGETAGLTTALKQVQEELDAANAETNTLTVAMQQLQAQLEAAQAESRRHAAAMQKMQEQLDTAAAETSTLGAAVQHAREQLDATELARAALAERLTTEGERVQVLERTVAENVHVALALEQAQLQLKTHHGERQALADELATHAARVEVLEGDVQQARALMNRMPAVFRAMGAARTMPETLTAVANSLTGLFPRVALFRAKGDRLEGVHQSGFDFTGDISNVVIPLTIDSLMSEAVSFDGVRALTSADLARTHALPFGGAATSAVVLPLKVDTTIVAALYADDGGVSADGSPSERLACLELVRDYAMARLQHVVEQERSLGELHGYAEMLLNEVERLYNADVAGGHDELTVRLRLLENLQTARRIYEQRVERDAPAASAFLEERIVAAARAGRTTPFGRDVLEVVFSDDAADDETTLMAAQAS